MNLDALISCSSDWSYAWLYGTDFAVARESLTADVMRKKWSSKQVKIQSFATKSQLCKAGDSSTQVHGYLWMGMLFCPKTSGREWPVVAGSRGRSRQGSLHTALLNSCVAYCKEGRPSYPGSYPRNILPNMPRFLYSRLYLKCFFNFIQTLISPTPD